VKMNIGVLQPTKIALQLVDMSVKIPRGVVEDVLVQVDKYVLPADFVVLDVIPRGPSPILLGRPFLATGRFMIDCETGEATVRVFDESTTLKLFETVKTPKDYIVDCTSVSIYDAVFASVTDIQVHDDPIKEIKKKVKKGKTNNQ
ncbi:UNVERIFIED_CONTAM: hypothetical protein ITH36_24740, partial [Salmonella enterica subsp. enterica serovar Weltevreden]